MYTEPAMQEQMRYWLREGDDAEAIESPQDFDYASACRKVEAVKPKLEQIIGHELRMDRSVQDATFFTELDWIQISDAPPLWHTILAIRFSAFGKLTMVWSVCPESLEVSPDVIDLVISELLAHGFRYVDESLLQEPYDGANSHFVRRNWYSRFFDYD